MRFRKIACNVTTVICIASSVLNCTNNNQTNMIATSSLFYRALVTMLDSFTRKKRTDEKNQPCKTKLILLCRDSKAITKVFFLFGYYDVLAATRNGAKSSKKKQLGEMITDHELYENDIVDVTLLQAFFKVHEK